MRRKLLTPATETAAHARDVLPALAPGASVAIELPNTRYWRREGYAAVNAVARAIFGSGAYRMKAMREAVTVTRVGGDGSDG